MYIACIVGITGYNSRDSSRLHLQASFAELKSLLDMAQHIAPAAFPAVLGAKADLNGQRKVDISDVLVG